MRTQVSVVIPAYNEARRIERQLAALTAQTYKGTWQVVVADNGSTDDTVERVLSWNDRLPLEVVDASARRGAAAARNQAVAASTGACIAFCDGDDAVAPDWLAHHVAALEHADLVAGAILHVGPVGSTTSLVAPDRAPTLLGWKPYGQTANCSVRRTTFDAVGGFQEHDNFVAEDVEFSWLAQLAGATFAYEPRAVVFKHGRSTWREHLRQYYQYGCCDVDLYQRFHKYGVPAPKYGRLAYTYLGLVARLPGLASASVRHRWTSQVGRRAGRIRQSFKRRVWYP